MTCITIQSKSKPLASLNCMSKRFTNEYFKSYVVNVSDGVCLLCDLHFR